LSQCEICNSDNYCQKCKNGYFIKHDLKDGPDVCVTSCGNRYYGFQGECHECDFRCFQCTGPSYSECDLCDISVEGVQKTEDRVCQCSGGYSVNEKEKKCELCSDPFCTNCDPYNSTKCYSCSEANSEITWDPLLFKCVCKVGSYKDGESCVPCNPFCSACSAPTNKNCLPKQCGDKSYPLDSLHTTCLYMCATLEDNMYIDPLSKTCKYCSPPCRSCFNEPKHCSSCIGKYVLLNNECIAECPLRYYSDKGVCLPCSERCVSCEFKTNYCIDSCTSPFVFKDHQCLDSCGDGFASLNRTCLPCDPFCANCYFIENPDNLSKSSKICTKCMQPKLMNDGKCVDECPPGKYANSDGLCKFCHEACKECSGGTNNECKNCNSDLGYLMVSEGRCDFMTCTKGYFYNRTRRACDSCPSACTECISLTNCTECVKGYNLSPMQKCINPCDKLGYTRKPDSFDCIGIFKLSRNLIKRNLWRWEKYENVPM